MPARPLRILAISSEVESLARTGGLGDVVEALSRTLGALGAEVVVVTPKYGVTRVPVDAHWWGRTVTARLGEPSVEPARELRVLEAHLDPLPGVAADAGSASPAKAARVCMVSDPALFDREGLYGDRRGPFTDNALRFAALSSAALSAAERAWDGALPDVVHAHDWHAASGVLYARRMRGPAWARVPAVFTIHNLAFQGALEESDLGELGLPRDGWDRGWMRHDGRVNLMKGAIEVADRVTTVSETYAGEIQRPGGGHGLDRHLAWYSQKLVGIVNGIDTASFDPRTDGAIARRYGEADAIEGKRACKQALCAELGLEGSGPLVAAISRLHWLKGVDMFLATLPALVERGARVVVVGTGEPELESALRAAAARWPGRVAVRVAFDPLLARRVFAASDFFVVASRDEPCGLTQMYAMRYGAVPVVTPVGGLRDTVTPLDAARASGTGVVAAGVDATSLLLACEEALGLWRDPIAMPSLVARAMARDSSWTRSARRYLALYEALAAAPGDRAAATLIAS